METSIKLKINSLKETEALAQNFAKCLDKKGLFVTLIGDIGAGKTQFVRYVLEFLNVNSKVTSPSFVILNEYKCNLFPIYHFDLYRLEEKGIKSIIEELREYSKSSNLTFIEWAEFAHNEIPYSSLKITINYDEDDVNIRWFEFSTNDSEVSDFIKKLKEKINEK